MNTFKVRRESKSQLAQNLELAIKTAHQVSFFCRVFTNLKRIQSGAVTYVGGGIAGTKALRLVHSGCSGCT